MRRQNWPLLGTVLLAVGVLAAVTAWLLTAPGETRGEALKTGGIAAGSVVALHALWLNDRQRGVDEERQELERFAKAVAGRGSAGSSLRGGCG